jgi:hypothetical protein
MLGKKMTNEQRFNRGIILAIVLAAALAVLIVISGCAPRVNVEKPTFEKREVVATPPASTVAKETTATATALVKEIHAVRVEAEKLSPLNLELKLPALLGQIDAIEITAQKVWEKAETTRLAALAKEEEARQLREAFEKSQVEHKESVEKFDTLNQQWQAKYDHLANDSFVKTALWIKRLIIWLAIGWAVLGVLGAVAGFSPWSWGMALSKGIIRVLPLANPFAWIRDAVLARKAKA